MPVTRKRKLKGRSISAKDLKLIHESAYKKVRDQNVGDWVLDDSISKTTASVYFNPKINQAIVVHRGTEGTLKDWSNNLTYLMGTNKKTSRFKESEAVQKAAEAKYPDVITTGHSQGGIYTKIAKDQKKVININPASMGETTEGTTIRSKSDPVSILAAPTNYIKGFIDPSSKSKHITTSAKFNPLAAHSLDILDELGDQQLGGKILRKYIKKLKGDGIFDDTKNFFNKTKNDITRTAQDTGNTLNKTANDAKNLLTKVMYGRTDLSPKVKGILDKFGDATILKATVGRTPVQGFITGIIKIVSSTPYDTLFHLFIELETTKGQLILEKNSQINMDVNLYVKRAQWMPVSNIPSNLTVNQLLTNTSNAMGDKFIPYSAKNNNCQNFIMNVLKSNNMSNPELLAFVKQDTEEIFKDPNFAKFANTVTDLGNRFDILSQGGKLKGSAVNETNDAELDRLMTYYNIKKYHGCFIKNELPLKLKNGFYIINLNGHSHWTALLKDGAKFYYFDSFGFPAPLEVEDKIPKGYIYSEKHIQTEPSTACGFYVVAWIKYMNEHKNKSKAYSDFIHSFEEDSSRNEGILKKYYLD